MIIQEQLENSLVRTYSNRNVYIHGGSPEGNYAEAIDPVSANRVYTETDIPIEEDEGGFLAPQQALDLLFGGEQQ